jgi:hypothetical protein
VIGRVVPSVKEVEGEPQVPIDVSLLESHRCQSVVRLTDFLEAADFMSPYSLAQSYDHLLSKV